MFNHLARTLNLTDSTPLRLLIPSLFFIFLILSACQDAYMSEIVEWRDNRFAELKQPYGWPSVVGLYEMRNSIAYFGNADTNDFVIANGPSSFGFLSKTDTGLVMNPYTSIKSKIDGEPARPVKLRTDLHPDGPTYGTHSSIQWHVIERNDTYFLRIKDSLSTYRSSLTEIPYYPIDERYKVTGRIKKNLSQDTSVHYKNILGMDISKKIDAVIEFEWEGNQHTLTAVENDESSYMIMVHDQTTGLETYGGGRYMYPDKADASGRVTLDFNKLINPPCVFTPFATCPLPPKSNHLPFEIKAGEKDLHLY